MQLVISDAHEGLKAAIGAVFAGAACTAAGRTSSQRPHPRAQGNAEMGPRKREGTPAAAIRTIFAPPDAEHVHAQLDMIATMLGGQFPAVQAMLGDAHGDLLDIPHRRRRCLPQPPSPAPPRRSRPGRDPRHARMSMTQDVYMGRRAASPELAAALESLADDQRPGAADEGLS